MTDRADQVAPPTGPVTGFGRVSLNLTYRLGLLILGVMAPLVALLVFNGIEQRENARRDTLDQAGRLVTAAALQHHQLIEGAHLLLTAIGTSSDTVNGDPLTCTPDLAAVRAAFPGYTRLAVVRPNGDMSCADVSLPGPINVGDRGYFQAALRERSFVIGEYLTNRGSGLFGVSLAYPVIDGPEHVQAVIAAQLDMGWFEQAGGAAGLPDGAAMTLIDGAGTVLRRYPAGDGFVDRAFPDQTVMETALGAPEGVTQAQGSDGVERLYAFATLESSGIQEVHLLLGIPTAVAFAPIDEQLRRSLVTFGLVALGALLAGWWLTRTFVIAPVQALVVASGRLGRGDRTARSGLRHGRDELGQLAGSFDAMADQLASLYTGLEHRVELRTRELQEANAELEEATQAKSRFLANMSHELRTPLSAIIGFSELLMDEQQWKVDAAARDEYVKQINTSGQHLLGLINDILDLSKVEAGQLELHPELVSISGVIDDALAMVQPLAAAKGISLLRDVPEAGELSADRGKLKQVLLNLLSNAIKFTPEGGRVEVEAYRSGPGSWGFSVRDNGGGIAPEEQAQLFQEFHQVWVDGQKPGGTGLGLALSKRLVELHGGEIWVESLPGVGSCFTFILPAQAGGPEEEPHAGTGDGAGRMERRPLALVVEDDAASAKLLRVYLTQGGFRVVVAGAREAVHRAKELRPAAITLDVLMPEMDGWEVLQSLKADPETRDIPVVIVTVVDQKELGLGLGAADYLIKPVNHEALLHALRRRIPAQAPGAGPPRVLVMDDDRQHLALMAAMIEPHGFTVLQADNGPDGVVLAESERPDLILLDLLMPGMSGFEVAQRLQSAAATRAIPILILTAKELTEEERLQLSVEVRGVLQKSSTGDGALLSRINEEVRLVQSRGV